MKIKKLSAMFITAALCLCTACSESGGNTVAPVNLPNGQQNVASDGVPAASDGTPAASAPNASAPAVNSDSGVPQTSSPASSVNPGTVTSQPATTTAVKVRDAEWNTIKWTKYESPYFTLSIPEGWTVDWRGNSQQLYWIVSRPDGNVAFENQDHLYGAKDANMMQTLGVSFSLSEGSVPELFNTIVGNKQDTFNVVNSCIPSNKEMLQSLRPYDPIRDYQSLYVQYTKDGFEGEGIYSAVIMESKDVYDRLGNNYGLWEINCMFTAHCPRGEMVSWEPIITTIAKSFNYTDYYIQEWMGNTGSSQTPENTVTDTDPVVKSFEERSKEDTIIQEKRSDMIGEYERVYDNENGKIYRAYNGFLQEAGTDQTRYSAITDSQYAEGYAGWIDKPGS